MSRHLRCSRCKDDLPVSQFHSSSSQKGRGYQNFCRRCMAEYQRERREARRNLQPNPDVEQTCIKCLETKSQALYYRHGNTKSGFETTCKQCVIERTAVNGSTPEARRKQAEYRRSPEGRAKYREICRAYYQRNKEEILEKQQPYNTAEWKRFRLEILERDNHTCLLTGEPADCVHHILPIDPYDEFVLEPWNCMSITRSQHGRIHGTPYGSDEQQILLDRLSEAYGYTYTGVAA